MRGVLSLAHGIEVGDHATDVTVLAVVVGYQGLGAVEVLFKRLLGVGNGKVLVREGCQDDKHAGTSLMGEVGTDGVDGWILERRKRWRLVSADAVETVLVLQDFPVKGGCPVAVLVTMQHDGQLCAIRLRYRDGEGVRGSSERG